MNVTSKKPVFRKVLSVLLAVAMVLGTMVSGNVQITQAGESVEHSHSYDAKGFCTDAECSQPYQEFTEGDGSESNPYKIYNAGQLYYFAALVNGKIDSAASHLGVNVKLMNDIIINDGVVNAPSDEFRQWSDISTTYYYYGTFDGNNHVISGLYMNKPHSGAALFERLSGTIKNLGIENSYIYGSHGIASLVYYSKGTIENCYSTATIRGTSSIDLCGLVMENLNDNGKIGKIKNSYFAGKIICDDWSSGYPDFYGIVGPRKENNINVYKGVCENCYYLSGENVIAGTDGVTVRTSEQFASGQVTYELNGGERSVFRQTLSGAAVSAEEVEKVPKLSGTLVARRGSGVCPGKLNTDSVTYFNGSSDDMTYTYENHNCDADVNPYYCKECKQILEHDCLYDNGFCKYCGGYEKPEGSGYKNSPYLIDNAGKLYYFAGIVNGDSKICTGGVRQNTSADAKLTADIVWNEGTVDGKDDNLRTWKIIDSYYGTFDGNNHTISGLYMYKPGNKTGMFGYLSGTCKNLGIINSYFCTEGRSIGSIAANLLGTIENCYSTACLEGYDSGYESDHKAENIEYAGGLAGELGSTVAVRNSYFAGTVGGVFDKENVFGGITGYYSYDTTTQTGDYRGTCENCYYITGTAVNVVREGAIARTAEQFASGQVTFELNGDQSKTVFGQTLSGEAVTPEAVQAFPVLGGKTVYEIMKKNCPGVSDQAASVVHGLGYTNQIAERYQYVYENHKYDTNDEYHCVFCGNVKEHEHVYDDGVCKHCGAFDKPKGDGSAENPYQITNASQLKWYAGELNKAKGAGKEYGANAVLTDDIYLNPEGVTAGSADAYYWDRIEMIPADNIFDGQGHTIYGLCYKGSKMFGFITSNKGTVRDVVISGVSVELNTNNTEVGIACINNYGLIEAVTVSGVVAAEKASYAGSICSYSKGIIRNCTSYVNLQVKADGQCTGGICGSNEAGSIVEYCINYGSVTGFWDVGGICGDMNEGSFVSHCFNKGNVTADRCIAGGIVGGSQENGSDLEGFIKCCFSTGHIKSGYSCEHMLVGGIIGFVSDELTIEQCYYAKGNVRSGIGFECKCCSSYEEIANAYAAAENIEQKNAEAFTNGEIVWLLNKAENKTWLYQTDAGEVILARAGAEGYPVVRKALFGCSGCKEPISAEYVRGEKDENSYVYRAHNYDTETLACTECGKVLRHVCVYDEDGYCTICHGIRQPEGQGTEEHPYEIGNVAELYWFAGLVNGDEEICKDGIRRNTKACAVLTRDIVINEQPLSEETTGAAVWTPIGSVTPYLSESEMSAEAYQGIFDGQGYTITGIYMAEPTIYLEGLFGCVEQEGMVKDVNLDNVYISGGFWTGGICGYMCGTVEGCSVSGKISAYTCAGGIVGVMGNKFVVGCHNMAQLEGENVGGIIGIASTGFGNILGCFNTGKLIGTNTESVPITEANGIMGYDEYTSYVKISGCYYLAETTGAAVSTTYGEPASAEEFASGKIAYKMNGVLKKNGYDAEYGQLLTGEKTQDFPVWKEKTRVYAVGVVSCPGVEGTGADNYSNNSSTVEYFYKDHLYEKDSYHCTFCGTLKEHTCVYVNGCCKYCSSYKKPEGNGTTESPYKIGSAPELYWFRDKVSGDLVGEEANPAACAVLTADIDIQAYAESVSKSALYWTPIGVSEKTGKIKDYKGTFDGQNYSISGVAVLAYEPSEQYVGVFGTIGEGATVKNLSIIHSGMMYGLGEESGLSIDESYIGAFCRMNKGVVSGCSVDVDFVALNENSLSSIAGLVGWNKGTIVNSSVSGVFELQNSLSAAAGICAINDGTLKGCGNEADINYKLEAAGVCIQNNGSIEECYNSGDISCESSYRSSAGICLWNQGSVENCWNAGKLAADSAALCYRNQNRVAYCFNVGEADCHFVYLNAKGGLLTDCYSIMGNCKKQCATVLGTKSNCETVTESDFMSGKIAYLLNVAQGRNVFGQVLNETDEAGKPLVSAEAVEAYPVPGSKTVYPIGGIPCPGCELLENVFLLGSGCTNILGDAIYTYPEHYYYADSAKNVPSDFCFFCKRIKNAHTCVYENGICETCGWFEAPEGDGSLEHPYKISNAGQLCYFAHAVEGSSVAGREVTGNAAACAVLTADINLADVPELSEGAVIAVSGSTLKWVPIGTDKGTTYAGTFDGNGYSIEGLSSWELAGALFAKIGKTAVVKNLTLSECNIHSAGAAGISIINEGTIENCMVSGWIEACSPDIYSIYNDAREYYKFTKWYYGAAMKLYPDLVECAINDGIFAAGGISEVNSGTIRSCFFNGVVIGMAYSDPDGCPAGFICADNTQGTVENCCYYDASSEQTKTYIAENGLFLGKGIGNEDKDGQTLKVTEEDIRSGKVAWMLDTDNAFEGNKGIWKQDEQAFVPTLASEGAVTMYYLSTTKLDKTIQEYYVPAGADISTYLQNTEGAKWVFCGGTENTVDGIQFTDTVMNHPVIIIKEAILPSGSIAIGAKNWTEFVKTDGYSTHQARGAVLNVTANHADTQIAYYIHKAASATESTLTVEELLKKSFTPYDAANKPVLNENGYTSVYVRLTSADGLVNYISTDGLVIEDPYLLSITAPKNITGVVNGTKKDAASLGLPATVAITTEDESITSAAVTWNLDNLVSGSYDSTVTTKQTFTVGGTVVLPEGINANGVSLTVQVTVTVEAKKTVTPDDPTPGEPTGSPVEPSDPDNPTPGTPDDPKPGTPTGSPVEPSDPDNPTPTGSPVEPSDPDTPTPGIPDDPDTPKQGVPTGSPVDPSDPDNPTPGTPDDPKPGEPTGSPVDPSTGEAVTPGDVNGDGEIKLNDAQRALRAALLLEELSGRAWLAADVNGDGKVKLDDAQQILRRALLLINEFKKVN